MAGFGPVPAAILALASALILAGTPAEAAAQDDDLEAACAMAGPAAGECAVAAAAVRLIHPRVGVALWGGSPVPGSASTLGMRIGTMPRISVSTRLVLLPMELPPLPDRSVSSGTRAMTGGLSGQVTVGLLTGWAPLPTVGGVGSVDVIGRLSWVKLPGDQGFDEAGVLGGSLGLRLGVVRESFTLPGISLTASYGRSTGITFGEPGALLGGHIEGGLTNLNATAAATKRIGPVGLTVGGAWDRYSSEVDFSYPGGPVGGQTEDAATDRWSGFVNASWTLLIFHASVEGGWQESPVPAGLPSGVSVDPAGWWIGGAFRVSI